MIELQQKLYCKAKQEGEFRFYILYDKMYIPYMLQQAYKRVGVKDGSPGLDNQGFEDIEKQGLDKFLQELGEHLRKRSYCPSPVKRVWIDKSKGGNRPLGIPTIGDRVAQRICKRVIEPICEADFEQCCYGFGAGRCSKDAMGAIKGHWHSGKTEVLDGDLSSYFDTIAHDKLQIALKQTITDAGQYYI